MRSQAQIESAAWLRDVSVGSGGPADDESVDDSRSLSSIFAALANDDRLAILAVLHEHPGDECSIEMIAMHAGLSRFATSRHLAILRAAGLILGLRSGHRFLHRLASTGFDDVDDWLLRYLADPAGWPADVPQRDAG